MIIYYLMRKTHNVTGLSYLCQTKRADPHKYPGSGVDWRIHIKEHGFDITTEILQECHTREELRHWGIYYSELWNVVDSPSWANIIPETGSGGGTSESAKRSQLTRKASGYIHSAETVAKCLATKLANGTLNTTTPEVVAKIKATKLANSTYIHIWTPEAIAAASVKRAQTIAAKVLSGERDQAAIYAKSLATKLAKGIAGKWPPEMLAKSNATRKANKDRKSLQ